MPLVTRSRRNCSRRDQTQEPPRITKPKKITQGSLERRFNNQYYRSKTDGWESVKIAEVIKNLKSYSEKVFEHFENELTLDHTFQNHTHRLVARIYEEFWSGIQGMAEEPKIVSVATDFLLSTGECGWLFMWLGQWVMSKWKRLKLLRREAPEAKLVTRLEA
ncbi:hypothetical protein TWF481_006257 [Arthrobotrys musiformis]|uniref:Uncharacterized protein n=1 Tax=Arthrobotrys musiformis TaxID=47236 RepID=A0AAV9WI59_9PEZI